MKRKFITTIIACIFTLVNYAQTPQITVTDSTYKPVGYVVDSLLSQLDLTDVTSGYLLDKGVATANVSAYNGQLEADALTYPEAWWAVYGSLYRSALAGRQTLAHPDVVREAVNTRLSQDEIPIMVMHHNFHEGVTDSTLLSQLIFWDGSYFQDVANRPQSPWLAKEAFAAAPFTLSITDQLTASFVLPSNLLLGNTSKTIQSVQADFDDANVWQNLTINEAIEVTWPDDGTKNI